MLRNYPQRTEAARGSPAAEDPAQAGPDALRELQKQWSKILTRCYELYAEGKRCLHEDDPLKRFDCTRCEYKDQSPFCQANAFLKRVVSLVAEHLASKRLESIGTADSQALDSGPDDGAEIDASSEGEEARLLTQAEIDDFNAQGISYEIETPLCAESVWLVPERTDQERVELTIQEVHFMAVAAQTLEGHLVEITHDPGPSTAQGRSDS